MGANTRRANELYAQELIRQGQGLYFDEEVVHHSQNILSPFLLQQFYGKQWTTRQLLLDKVIAPSPSAPEEYAPTHAGLLLFSEEPQLYLPEATILCTRFKGTQGREITQSEELIGPLGELAEKSLKLLLNWLMRDFTLKGSVLKGKSLIPEEALREAIINALIHRKYSIPGAIKIAIYEDRLEIFSPGNFPGLIALKNLGDGTTFLRNPAIARLARKMGLVEKLGTGIRLIFESCQQAEIKKPEYFEDGDFVKLVFYFQVVPSTKLSDVEKIMHLAQRQASFQIKDVMELLGVSRNTATRKINILIRQNKIQRFGKGPAVFFNTSPESSAD